MPEGLLPAWEVDRFQWPDEIEQLFKVQAEYFEYAGKKLVAASREGLKILAITATRRGEGSTTLALCLARAAASAGARVGLLDGNLNHSELGGKLGVDFGSGWQSAAAFEQPLAEAAVTGLEEGITLFPSTVGPVSDIKSLGDERVGQVFRAAAASCDLLIIDAGTADLGRNVETLDAAIVARDVRHTSKEETLAVATALRNCGVKAIGIAENFSSSHSNRAAA
jgi:Mrp family chromosome partitioning ATPase